MGKKIRKLNKHFQDRVLDFLKKQISARGGLYLYSFFFLGYDFFLFVFLDFLIHLCVQDSSLSLLVISLNDVKTKTEVRAEFGQFQYDSHLA